MLTNEMTDKELLELAAKAAGCVYLTNGQLYVEGKGNIDWNPLTDDGDALRLAVTLGLIITPNYHVEQHKLGVIAFTELEDSDNSYAATRRAIVRAAAEIGKEMK